MTTTASGKRELRTGSAAYAYPIRFTYAFFGGPTNRLSNACPAPLWYRASVLRPFALVLLATTAFAALVALAACDGPRPAAYPTVRYEAEPFPPPAPRGVPVDAGFESDAEVRSR